MDELEKKPETPQESAARRPEKKNDFDNRRKLMYILCGGYLIYLAIKMGRDYPQLAASGEWTGERIAALCGTIGFAVIGAALLAVVAVRFVREWKEEAQRELERQAEEAEKTEEAMKLISIGFGNAVAAGRILAVVSPDSAPIKRVVQEARERGMLLDASFGRRTKSVLLMDTDHVILSSVTPETIAARMEEKNAEETSVQP